MANPVNLKILFVDDEPATLKLYKLMLQGQFDIATAASGEDGLTLLRKDGPFAIVVSDMQMPGMDRVQFLNRARQIAPATIRFLLTGKVDLQGAVKAVNEGSISRFLLKPCEESVLREAITAALGCYQARKEDRVRIELPVYVRRSSSGQEVQPAHTADISNSGVRLGGLEESLEPGEVLSVEYGNRRAPFRVVWSGERNTATAGQAGLECLALDADIWNLDLAQLEKDETLNRAREVQSAMLPRKKPPLKTLDYSGHCIQARMVRGDYYDFIDFGPGEVGFVLADVSGKGVAAALLMASLQGNLQSQCSMGSNDLAQLLASLNLHLCKHTANQRYVTLFFGRYSDATRTMHYVNCGHNPPLLLHKAGEMERLDATATVLGLFLDWECSVASVQLETGDILNIYTDGITETRGQSGAEFGEARLLETLCKNRDLGSADILRNVEDAVEQFRLGGQEDDLTLVIARAL
jgi:CheY-like chemotaxis protein